MTHPPHRGHPLEHTYLVLFRSTPLYTHATSLTLPPPPSRRGHRPHFRPVARQNRLVADQRVETLTHAGHPLEHRLPLRLQETRPPARDELVRVPAPLLHLRSEWGARLALETGDSLASCGVSRSIEHAPRVWSRRKYEITFVLGGRFVDGNGVKGVHPCAGSHLQGLAPGRRVEPDPAGRENDLDKGSGQWVSRVSVGLGVVSRASRRTLPSRAAKETSLALEAVAPPPRARAKEAGSVSSQGLRKERSGGGEE